MIRDVPAREPSTTNLASTKHGVGQSRLASSLAKKALMLMVICTTPMLLANEEESVNKRTGSADDIEEVIVKGRKYEPKFEATEFTQKLMQTAGTFGDPLQAIFSLPGIVQVDEEDAEPAVQGSSPRANLFLVDDLPVAFLFHSFGESIFNENLIHDFGLNTAGFGAAYGQATGAVFDVSLRDPKNQPIESTVDLSFLRLGYLAEGATSENQSFYFSYRESLIPLYIEDDEEDDIAFDDAPRAWDYQGKYLWLSDDNSSLTLQVTGARDKATATFGSRSEEVLRDPGFEGGAKLDEEFHSQGLTWRNEDIKLVLGHILSAEESRIGNGEFIDIAEDTWVLKAAKSWTPPRHRLAIGAEIQYMEFDYNFDSRLDRCSDFVSDECDFDLGDRVQDQRVQSLITYDAFIDDQWSIGERVTLTSGIHLSKDDYLENAHVDPRASIDWQFVDNWTITGSIGKYHQLPSEEEMFPVIGNPDLGSIESTHYVVGLNRTVARDWSWDVEIYYKDIDNLIVGIEDGATPFLNRGEGKAYGLEVMVSKERTNRWYGWLSLSASKTERTNELTGQTVPFSYDVPLVINAVVNYQINPKWNIGGRWTYRTGTLYTPIIGNRENPDYPGFYIPVYGELNSERVANFHRLDLRIERRFRDDKVLLFFDFLNLYGRDNSSGIEYTPIANSPDFRREETEGLGFIPSVGVKFTF